MIGGRITQRGAGRVELMFRQFAVKVPDTARAQMKRSAQAVVNLAQIMVPEDEGSLRDSIRIERTYGSRGRLQIQIVVGNQTVIKYGSQVVSLDQYALIIHENYESMRPGKNTLAKMSANPGVKIGSQFLFRALKKVEEGLARAMIVAIEKTIRQGQE